MSSIGRLISTADLPRNDRLQSVKLSTNTFFRRMNKIIRNCRIEINHILAVTETDSCSGTAIDET
jgi:hypothetical protein